MPAIIVEGKVVDSYRFSGPAAKIMRQAIPQEPQYDWIPWTPLKKPLSTCRVALLTTAGISLTSDPPFNMERERQNPYWGDPSFRRLPSWATEKDIAVNHIHIKTEYIYQDLDVALPLQRFQELAQSGEIGELAPTHYSIMGYNTDPTDLVCATAPRIATQMNAEGVEVAFLVPV
ncbi:MAG TPA: glycine/sarcosine/betaine reductase selenoprotein B family protein [Methylomirabilota bacterium]|jgi:D-proline reductase (dithiol) PrdB|nr:glycine/sarcosine/betaine reductase selenoprotein B family protein [Methylomirabilota bacterium]